MKSQTQNHCTSCCPHYCDLGLGEVMCTKDSPRLIMEQWIPNGFFGWCKKEKPLPESNQESGKTELTNLF